MADVTQILNRLRSDSKAQSELLQSVYDELRRIAASQMANESSGQTLQPTALVHEAWVRLVQSPSAEQWQHRRHFYGAAAEAMRRILIDAARRRAADRHGGRQTRISLPHDLPASVLLDVSDQVEELNLALEKFRRVDPIAFELVNLRYFAGLSIPAAAEILDMAPRSADRLWAWSRAWLLRELSGNRDL